VLEIQRSRTFSQSIEAAQAAAADVAGTSGADSVLANSGAVGGGEAALGVRGADGGEVVHLHNCLEPGAKPGPGDTLEPGATPVIHDALHRRVIRSLSWRRELAASIGGEEGGNGGEVQGQDVDGAQVAAEAADHQFVGGTEGEVRRNDRGGCGNSEASPERDAGAGADAVVTAGVTVDVVTAGVFGGAWGSAAARMRARSAAACSGGVGGEDATGDVRRDPGSEMARGAVALAVASVMVSVGLASAQFR
jgi:hypothetical protein